MEELLCLLFRIVVEVILFYTGEIVIYIFTLGRRKPRFNYYYDSDMSRFIIFTEISVWIGFLFWVLLGIFIAQI